MFNRFVKPTKIHCGIEVVRHSAEHSRFERFVTNLCHITRRCCYCGWRRATWSYMPGWENACDKCVPRGCSCNKELKPWIDNDSHEALLPENYYDVLDEHGRKQPCCEWSLNRKTTWKKWRKDFLICLKVVWYKKTKE
jgi:hypothetical protein